MKLKTVKIRRGNEVKEYVPVNERIRYFRENFSGYSLETEIVEMTDDSILMKAYIKNENGRVMATGYASELKSNGFINKTSHIENCETSAWGRCLANFGIGVDDSVASAEEVDNVQFPSPYLQSSQSNKTPEPKQKSNVIKQKPLLTSGDMERFAKMVGYAKENGIEAVLKMVRLNEDDLQLLKDSI